jgi:beta-barrel assembly-enhancing protease
MKTPCLALVISLILAVGGCIMAPGDSPITSSSISNVSNAKPGQIAFGDKGAERNLTPWETSYDPYSYRDIRPGSRPKLDTEEAGFWLLVDKVESQLRTAGNRIQDPALTGYLEDLVCKLAGPYCPDIKTYVVRVPAFNASMMANGTMQIWSGFLLRCHNEAQIAAVLGHEIAHYIRRHSIQRFQDQVARNDALTVLSLGLMFSGLPGEIGQMASYLSAASQMAFGRDHEREADHIGISLLNRYGYDAHQASKVWGQLIREEEASGKPSGGSFFFSSHPASEEREATLKEIATKLQGDETSYTKGKDRYLEVLTPWRKLFLRDEINQGNFKTSLTLMEMLLEEGFNKAETLYFKGEIYRHRAKSNKDKKEMWGLEEDDPDKLDQRDDFEIALEIYQSSIKEGDPPPQLYRSTGLIQSRRGKTEEAQQAFKKYLALIPDAQDRKVIEFMALTGN